MHSWPFHRRYDAVRKGWPANTAAWAFCYEVRRRESEKGGVLSADVHVSPDWGTVLKREPGSSGGCKCSYQRNMQRLAFDLAEEQSARGLGDTPPYTA